MGCNCKTGDGGGGFGSVDNKHIKFTSNIVFKFVLFLISIPILTILYPFVILILFKTIVLSDSTINATKFLKKFADRMKGNQTDVEDEDEENDGEINPDDYEIVEKVDVIK